MKNLKMEDFNKITLKPPPTREDDMHWGARHSKYHKIGDYYPYEIVDRVIKKYLGAKVNDAFSYFCTLVPKYQQGEFYDGWHWDKNRNYYGHDFYVDKGGFIRKRILKQPSKEVTLYSHDYKEELRHKVTGRPIPEWYGRWFSDLNDYVPVCIKGWERTFSSKFDPLFMKLNAEENQKKRRILRLKNKELQEREYKFKHDAEDE